MKKKEIILHFVMASKHFISMRFHGFIPLLLVTMGMIRISNCEEVTTTASPFPLSSLTIRSLLRSQRSDENQTQLFGLARGNYYTMYQIQTHVALEIKADGRIKWDHGTPTLFSVFREHATRQKTSGERIFTLEAAATDFWICMNGKGRLYTIHRYRYQRMEMRKKQRRLKKIRHIEKKKRIGGGGRRWMVRNGNEDDIETTFPPSDCVFKIYEFTPNESYEGAVGIYSSKHSNSTHGRFLSMNPKTGVPRTFRKPFRNLANHPNLKIQQVPINSLEKMVRVTRFGREETYNGVVRECIVKLLINCKKRLWRRQVRREEGEGHLQKIIERCTKRAVEGKVTPPKCSKKGARRRNRKEARRNIRKINGVESF